MTVPLFSYIANYDIQSYSNNTKSNIKSPNLLMFTIKTARIWKIQTDSCWMTLKGESGDLSANHWKQDINLVGCRLMMDAIQLRDRLTDIEPSSLQLVKFWVKSSSLTQKRKRLVYSGTKALCKSDFTALEWTHAFWVFISLFQTARIWPGHNAFFSPRQPSSFSLTSLPLFSEVNGFLAK